VVLLCVAGCLEECSNTRTNPNNVHKLGSAKVLGSLVDQTQIAVLHFGVVQVADKLAMPSCAPRVEDDTVGGFVELEQAPDPATSSAINHNEYPSFTHYYCYDHWHLQLAQQQTYQSLSDSSLCTDSTACFTDTSPETVSALIGVSDSFFGGSISGLDVEPVPPAVLLVVGDDEDMVVVVVVVEEEVVEAGVALPDDAAATGLL
jgi:hypothetical protein